jgi:hypothetical protein
MIPGDEDQLEEDAFLQPVRGAMAIRETSAYLEMNINPASA